MKLEENMSPGNLKGIEKGLDIYGFGIVEYSVMSDSGRIIALRDQAYYVPGSPKDLRIIPPKEFHTRRVQGYLHSSLL